MTTDPIMAKQEHPQIYLITPPELDLDSFPTLLSSVLDATAVACVRLSLSTQDETVILRTGDALREITHARDIPLVIDTHVAMVGRLGLDGVHLQDGARSVRYVRKELGDEAIIGAFCGTSRHDGMNAGEAGADYVSFGPVGKTSLGSGDTVDLDLFTWWSEVVEVPVVAEGGLDEETLSTISHITDFVGFGPEVWGADDPAHRLTKLAAKLG
jgi:thiamine-phosphate pyrophosphorylase